MYDQVPEMCSFALHRGKYCTGDTQKPATHDPKCPHYIRLHPMHDSDPEEYR